MTRVYATASQYGELAEEDFRGDEMKLNKRLRAASIEVEKLTRLSVYEVDEDGYPVGADIAEAFTEATCAVVEHWEDTDDPRGVDAQQGAVKILSVSLGTTSSGSSDMSPRERLTRRIGDKALDILTNAGLITAAVSY